MSDEGSFDAHLPDEQPLTYRHDPAESFGGFHFGLHPTESEQLGQVERCLKCHGNQFKMLEVGLVCRNCGQETNRHVMNVEVEFNPVTKNKNKMKVDAVKEKVAPAAASPTKRRAGTLDD